MTVTRHVTEPAVGVTVNVSPIDTAALMLEEGAETVPGTLENPRETIVPAVVPYKVTVPAVALLLIAIKEVTWPLRGQLLPKTATGVVPVA